MQPLKTLIEGFCDGFNGATASLEDRPQGVEKLFFKNAVCV